MSPAHRLISPVPAGYGVVPRWSGWATYFLNPAWFLDFSYGYARTNNRSGNFSSPFTNPHGADGTTITGTLVGTSTGKVITQGLALTINVAF